MILVNKIPSSLADDATYPDLEGNYGRPLPTTVEELTEECKNRARDVVVLITSIDNNNAEMEAIRKINEEESDKK